MDYYARRLSADRLRRCYELAPLRVQQYLRAEAAHVISRIRPDALVLELGCGYGRVLAELRRKTRRIVGMDTSQESLVVARGLTADGWPRLLKMDAAHLAFNDSVFDAVVCVQNGISAFHVDPRALVRESCRVTRAGGVVLFSSYADSFWDDRMEWFRLQAAAGLVGEIDEEKTRQGTIACKDGFTATTFSAADFLTLTSALNVPATVVEVDHSSVFCEISVP